MSAQAWTTTRLLADDPVAGASLLVVVEDDPDVALLIETIVSLDSRFSVVGGPVATAEDALELARTTEPGIIVLDHDLAGGLTGLEAAAQIKAVSPQAKIILFTAHAELRGPAAEEPAIDAFLLKSDPLQLLQVAQRLTGMDVRAA